MTNLVTRWQEELELSRERDRLHQAYLHGPLPKNPPHLTELVKVRVRKPFGLASGEVAEAGAIVELQRHDALSMQALGRVEILG